MTSEIINSKYRKAHYYNKESNPVFEIIGKTTGKPRNITINDVRQNGYLPSVTTIISECNNSDSLNNWKLNILAEIMMTHQIGAEPYDEYRLWLNNELEKQLSNAARIGNRIHDAAANYLLNHVDTNLPKTLKIWIDENIESPIEIEKIFISEYFAGKIDAIVKLKSGDITIIDWKSQKFTSSPHWYDDHKWQLCAYAQLYNKPARLINVYYSTITEKVESRELKDNKYFNTWNSMLAYYRNKKDLI